MRWITNPSPNFILFREYGDSYIILLTQGKFFQRPDDISGKAVRYSSMTRFFKSCNFFRSSIPSLLMSTCSSFRSGGKAETLENTGTGSHLHT
jgi:hypothetical protein